MHDPVNITEDPWEYAFTTWGEFDTNFVGTTTAPGIEESLRVESE